MPLAPRIVDIFEILWLQFSNAFHFLQVQIGCSSSSALSWQQLLRLWV